MSCNHVIAIKFNTRLFLWLATHMYNEISNQGHFKDSATMCIDLNEKVGVSLSALYNALIESSQEDLKKLS